MTQLPTLPTVASVAPIETYRAPEPATDVETWLAPPREWSRDWQIPGPSRAEPEPTAGGVAIGLEPATAVATIEPDVVTHAPIEHTPDSEPAETEPVGAEKVEAEPIVVALPTAHANGSVEHDGTGAHDAVPPQRSGPRRTRRRAESSERPGRLLGGAGFLLAAIACFIGSFVLFVRLTTPDRSAPSIYTVVPYVAAAERGVPPAITSFAGEIGSDDMWLVVRLPVAARYVALTGLRTIDRWTSTQFSLLGTRPTYAPNVASCYSGAGVVNGPPELTPLLAGLVVRENATSSLSTERLVRVDVGALLADATGMKTLVCAIASPARIAFSSYAATIGDPNVMAVETGASRLKLAVLPVAVDFSAFGNAAAMRFTQTALAVATDPLHATLDVAGFETFAYNDPDGDARRDVLLFITGALATLGLVAAADALRPWLNIERR